MLEALKDRLIFTFPDVHPKALLQIAFQRTFRIPDDDKDWPLPPGLGSFPLEHVEPHKERLSSEIVERGGVLLPMYQSEALWIHFKSEYIVQHAADYPFAIKVSAGKRSALTGESWEKGLREKDYCVAPQQPWIDGFVVDKGVVRQFVANGSARGTRSRSSSPVRPSGAGCRSRSSR